eukprot:NODE_3645_length_760_cov_272.761702.p2 GENE.NODE_3645_length_760_cov_272.761702~~NODE_3645_length_760_cov_272.761702.p2  ORF type:complete len:132 (+),score=10.50 NODE_3645_length_760_cov_272.761702:169-564(+)
MCMMTAHRRRTMPACGRCGTRSPCAGGRETKQAPLRGRRAPAAENIRCMVSATQRTTSRRTVTTQVQLPGDQAGAALAEYRARGRHGVRRKCAAITWVHGNHVGAAAASHRLRAAIEQTHQLRAREPPLPG